MPDLDDKFNDQFQFLQYMSTEKLKSIVRADFDSGEVDDAANDELITHVMEVITQRAEMDPTAPHFDVEAGWANFQKQYNAAKNSSNRDIQVQRQADLKTHQSKRAGHRRILRLIGIAAIAACLCAAAASAFELNIFQMFAQWTQEIFQFQSETISGKGLGYDAGIALNDSQTLHDLLEEHGITDAVSPHWIPAGFQVSGLNAYTDISEPMFTALYENPETGQAVLVSATVHSTPQASLHEKDTTQVDVYSVGGRDHYLMENNGALVSTWFVENVECSISGDISEDELKTMINSIYEE